MLWDAPSWEPSAPAPRRGSGSVLMAWGAREEPSCSPPPRGLALTNPRFGSSRAMPCPPRDGPSQHTSLLQNKSGKEIFFYYFIFKACCYWYSTNNNNVIRTNKSSSTDNFFFWKMKAQNVLCCWQFLLKKLNKLDSLIMH